MKLLLASSFLRHWNRGDFNSCTRTDLTFKPVPDSKLARKREERMRKQAEKEREDREKAAAQAQAVSIWTESRDHVCVSVVLYIGSVF